MVNESIKVLAPRGVKPLSFIQSKAFPADLWRAEAKLLQNISDVINLYSGTTGRNETQTVSLKAKENMRAPFLRAWAVPSRRL